MRVLLADDDAELTTMLRGVLDRMGHVVDAVATGEDALWLAEACEYDALILDVNLPASDGFTVCQELRTRGDWTPILFLTGRTAVADRVTGLDVGGDDYLAKPFALEELAARLRTFLAASGANVPRSWRHRAARRRSGGPGDRGR